MPNAFLGLDTSNYTTSAAWFCPQTGELVNAKKLLPVKPGTLGLRQSDAVFHHTQQLPQVLEQAFSGSGSLCGVGVSTRPRAVEGSYMPCFTVGMLAAYTVSCARKIPEYTFSHQQGHIAAALYSAGKLSLLQKKFLAFHVSGGTTEALMVTPDKDGLPQAQYLAGSLDLKAGQAIDRVGVMLGLPFPAGPYLEQLALAAPEKKVRPSMKGADCSLSGIENHAKTMLQNGEPKETIARYALEAVLAALDAMCEALLSECGTMQVVFSGGVASNSILRTALQKKYGASFAAPAFSADNAAGIAILTALQAGSLSLEEIACKGGNDSL